jgi:hypothetical protein
VNVRRVDGEEPDLQADLEPGRELTYEEART